MAAMTQERGKKKELVGTVVSDKMDKTIVVSVERWTVHRLYGRRLKRSRRFKVHDEHNEARVGDTVRVVESRPYARDKSWRLVGVIERSK